MKGVLAGLLVDAPQGGRAQGRHRGAELVRRARRRAVGVMLRERRLRFLRRADVRPRADLQMLGTRYGGWVVATAVLGADAVCYLAGLGTDASFDLALIDRFGCTVHAFDPVPEAAAYAATVHARESRFRFHPVGLWSTDAELIFYAPEKPGWISHTAVASLRGTPAAFTAQVRSLPSLMRELSHDHIDVLKLSVEGAEHEILETVLGHRLDVRQLCVEFTPPQPVDDVLAACRRLSAAGYDLVAAPIQPWGWKCTFVRRDIPDVRS